MPSNEAERLASVTVALSFKYPVRRRPRPPIQASFALLLSFLVLVLWSCGRLSRFSSLGRSFRVTPFCFFSRVRRGEPNQRGARGGELLRRFEPG